MSTPTRVQSLRSSVKLARPANGSREPGELYTNWPDRQIGVIDGSKVPADLVAVRFFSTTTDYAVGDYVWNAGNVYRAKSAVTAGTFNPAQWDKGASTPADLLASLLTVDGAGSGLDADLFDGADSALFARLASPAFSGNPTAPTPTAGDNDTSIATTQFVTSAIATQRTTDNSDFVNVSGDAMTGALVLACSSTSPTAAPGTNTTQTASTAFVGAAIGVSDSAQASALALKANIASPVFTVDPQAPTPAVSDNDTSIATTAYVKS